MLKTAVAKQKALKTMNDIRMDSYAARLFREGFEKGYEQGQLTASRNKIKLALETKFPNDPQLSPIFSQIDQCQDLVKLKAVGANSLKLASLDQFSLN